MSKVFVLYSKAMFAADGSKHSKAGAKKRKKKREEGKKGKGRK